MEVMVVEVMVEGVGGGNGGGKRCIEKDYY